MLTSGYPAQAVRLPSGLHLPAQTDRHPGPDRLHLPRRLPPAPRQTPRKAPTREAHHQGTVRLRAGRCAAGRTGVPDRCGCYTIDFRAIRLRIWANSPRTSPSLVALPPATRCVPCCTRCVPCCTRCVPRWCTQRWCTQVRYHLPRLPCPPTLPYSGLPCPGYPACSWASWATLPCVLTLLLGFPGYSAQCTNPAPGLPGLPCPKRRFPPSETEGGSPPS